MSSRKDQDAPIPPASMQNNIMTVANILRGVVLNDLELERNEILDQIRQKRQVQVTGPNGIPIYAKGQLEDGLFIPRYPDLWCTKMKRCSPCPLSNLQHVEVRFMGEIVAAFEGYSAEFAAFTTNPNHLDSTSEGEGGGGGGRGGGGGGGEKGSDQNETFNLCFTPGTIWMQVDIGWKRSELQELGLRIPERGTRRRDEEVQQRVQFEKLSTFLLKQQDQRQHRTCNFISISSPAQFVKDIVPHAIMDQAQLRMQNSINNTFKRVHYSLKEHGVLDNEGRLHFARRITTNEIGLEAISDERFEAIVLDYVDTFNRVNVSLESYVVDCVDCQKLQDLAFVIVLNEAGLKDISDDEIFNDIILNYVDQLVFREEAGDYY